MIGHKMDIGLRTPRRVERLYIDFDSFFASVEQQLNPELRGRPVGVLPIQSDSTCVIAASYEAKAFGIKTGTPVREAKAKCPDIALPVARHDEYVRQHRKIVDVVNRHVPVIKVWSIDEVECELIGREQTTCVEIARAIKADLADHVGTYIVPSIGIAPNQFLAKVAAEMDKPNGLIVLHPDDLPGRLFDLELKDLPGVAASMENRLRLAGINTVEDLWNLTPKHARAIWRNVEGERMWAQLRGFAVSRPETVRRMFGHGRVLGWQSRTPDKALGCARLLTVKAARRMRREGYAASVFSLSLRGQTGMRWASDLKLSPAGDDHTFLKALGVLFDQGIASLYDTRIKKLSVALHGLVPFEQWTDSLFDSAKSRAQRRRWDTLMTAMDGLNSRYEKCVVSVGVREEPPGGYAGAKIAFGRIPDLEDF